MKKWLGQWEIGKDSLKWEGSSKCVDALKKKHVNKWKSSILQMGKVFDKGDTSTEEGNTGKENI